MILPRPDIGQREFLVYGDCPCGWRMAAHEGAHWPKCPMCGEEVLPQRGDGKYPLGYVALLLPELEALATVRKENL